MSEVSITERYDLQEFICNSPEQFFSEIGETLFLIGKEITPSDTVQDRIDILAIDREGHSVIVELKRANHKLHLLQAISYAGMVSKWQSSDFIADLDDDRVEELSNFLEVDIDDINRQQRIILVAEAFDYALLVSAEWLTENYGVNITCCRISMATDTTVGGEYLSCSSIYPSPELAQQAIPRGRRKLTKHAAKWNDWTSALEAVENHAIVEFFQKELQANRDNYLRKRILRYWVKGKRRISLTARSQRAYGWQHQRFDGDIEFWQKELSQPEGVEEVKDGNCLRFYLHTKDDFDRFLNVFDNRLSSVDWQDSNSTEDDVAASLID